MFIVLYVVPKTGEALSSISSTVWLIVKIVLFILLIITAWTLIARHKKRKAEKLAQEKKNKSQDHADDHTDPEVEKHTNDDHAHHGDTWYTKFAARFMTILITGLALVAIFFIIKYAFFSESPVSFDDEVQVTAKVSSWSKKILIESDETIHFEGYGHKYALKDDQGNVYNVGPDAGTVHIPNTGYLKVKSRESESFPVRFFY
jgi:Ni/Co efflux regulator RcnB